MPTLQRRTQQERTAETQRRLKDAAIEALVQTGWRGASTTEICRRAGVSRGAQVHHYPSKAELMAAAVEHLIVRRHAEFRAAVKGFGRDPGRLQSILFLIWRIYAGDTLQAWLELVIAGRTDPELRAHLQQVDARFFDDVKQTCARLLGDRAGRADAELDAFVRMVLAFFDGLALRMALSDGPAQRREREDAVRTFEALMMQWITSR